MNWLSLFSEPERRAIVAEAIQLALTDKFALKAMDALLGDIEAVVGRVLDRHGLTDSRRAVKCPTCNPDPVLTTAHGPILDLISCARAVADDLTVPWASHAKDLQIKAAAAEAALPKVKL